MSPDKQLLEETLELYFSHFGTSPEAVAICPGRVNLIGEHTDYSAGFVLPAAIPLYTMVAVGPGSGKITELWSSRFGEAQLPVGQGTTGSGFSTYLAGAIHEAGLEKVPLRIATHGNLPVEAGLSSSASLLVGTLAALTKLGIGSWELGIGDKGKGKEDDHRGHGEKQERVQRKGVGDDDWRMEVALAARRVENDFVGVPCGFMDQFAVSHGLEGTALLLDCLDNTWLDVPAQIPGHEWVIIYSGIQRELTAGGYEAKVDSVKRGLTAIGGGAESVLRTHSPGLVMHLARESGVAEEDLSPLIHICTENARVHLMRHALEKGDAGMVGTLLTLGHASLSGLFGVSTPALDSFVEAGSAVPGVQGIRLTGAGMGGSLVALVEQGEAGRIRQDLERLARTEIQSEARVYAVERFVEGVRVVV
jgi:galactokinase